MRAVVAKLYQRVTNFGLALMLAVSSVTAVLAFSDSNQASALPLTDYKLTAQPATQTIEAGTGVATINTFAEYKFIIGGWNDFLSPLSDTTIVAESTTAEVSTDQSSWAASAAVTADRFTKAEGTFYVRASTLGAHAINLSAAIETSEGVRNLTATATVNVEDTTAPGKATSPSPADGSTLNMDTLRAMGFSWTAPDDVSPITFEYGVTKAENKDELWPDTGGFVWTIPNYNGSGRVGSSTPAPDNDLPDGDYYWKVRYTDSENNVGPWSDAWKFTIDSTAPTITWQLQPLSIYGDGQGFHVRPITNEVGTNKSVYFDSVDPSNLCYNKDSDHKNMDTKNTHCQELFDSLSDGTHKFIAVFTDAAGNTTQSSSNSFIIDRTGPTITVKDGYVGSLADKVFSNVSFSLYDQYQVDKYVINGHTSDFTNNKWSDANFQNIKNRLIEGNNVFVLYDVAGNSTTYEFVYDATAPDAPVLSVIGLNSGDVTNQYSITATWTKPSDDTVKYEYKYWNNISTSAYNDETAAWYVHDLTANSLAGVFNQGEGAHYIQVRAADAAGNWSDWSNTFELVYDATAPNVTINALVTTDTTPTLTGTVDADAVEVIVTIDGVDYVATINPDGTWTLVLVDPLAVGSYPAVVTARDSANNEGTANATITVEQVVVEENNPDTTDDDETAPQLTVTPQISANDPDVLGDQTEDEDEAVNGDQDVAAAQDENNNNSSDNESTAGLAWYWWLVIIAAAAGLGWWIIAALRRRSAEN